MKIAIIGYGKMGKTIERLALEKGQDVLLKIDRDARQNLQISDLQQADVAIEFSRPEAAFDNIAQCLRAGTPVVTGTTGWLDRLEEAKTLCQSLGGAFFYASNFSIGVNIFFAVNRYLAGLMNNQADYDVRIEEIHHTQKLDAPSGTAITLANQILSKIDWKENWVGQSRQSAVGGQQSGSMSSGDELVIFSKREGEAPGTHIVTWDSDIDTIEISHTAHSREGFAAGALAAAGWLIGKQGFFEMKDMLGF